jgi:hypothetical protein
MPKEDPERQDKGDPDDKEFDSFADLTRNLIRVPKAEIDQQRRKATENQTHAET